MDSKVSEALVGRLYAVQDILHAAEAQFAETDDHHRYYGDCFNAVQQVIEALSRRAAEDDATERAEIVSILRERCDQDFDGECHLTNAEADRIIAALTNTSDEGVLP